MKFTDVFLRRPVLAIVVNLVIIIAGLQAIRTLNVRQYPRLESATTELPGAICGAAWRTSVCRARAFAFIVQSQCFSSSSIAGRMTPGALLQFVLLSVFAAGAVGALGESWGDVQKAAGAMERIDELMRSEAAIRAALRTVDNS